MIEKYLEWVGGNLDIVVAEFITWFLLINILVAIVCSMALFRHYVKNRNKMKDGEDDKDERQI